MSVIFATAAISAAPTIAPAMIDASPSIGSAAAAEGAIDGTKVSEELRDLVTALHAADEAAEVTSADFNAAFGRYEAWSKKNNPEPRNENRRAWRKWNGSKNAYLNGSDFYIAQNANVRAQAMLRDALMAVAKYHSRDWNELAFKACLVMVYEEGKRGYSHPILSQGVAVDVARIGMGFNENWKAGWPIGERSWS